jgi:hypothetical protein
MIMGTNRFEWRGSLLHHEPEFVAGCLLCSWDKTCAQSGDACFGPCEAFIHESLRKNTAERWPKPLYVAYVKPHWWRYSGDDEGVEKTDKCPSCSGSCGSSSEKTGCGGCDGQGF